MSDQRRQDEHEMPEFPQQRDDSPYASLRDARDVPGGGRHHVADETGAGAVARPGGGAQNPAGALPNDDEEHGDGPGRGAD